MQQPDTPPNNSIPHNPSVQPKISRLATTSLVSALLILVIPVIFQALAMINPSMRGMPPGKFLAIFGLVLGFLLILMVISILCGHVALAKIKRAMGALTGKGRAIAGLVLSYLLILIFIPILFIGARAWKKGSERAGCILNQRNVQQAVRSYQGMNNKQFGSPIDWKEIFGPGKMFEKEPSCPAHGKYTFKTTVPEVGEMAVECSLSNEPDKHELADHHDW